MHNNYYFLRHLSLSLEQILKDSVISECFSQNKEELIIRFEISAGSFYIKASLLPGFSCLSFPEKFHRARKNSVDLFENLIGQRVAGLRQFNNERSFAITLSNSYTLLFKMHASRSNIILFDHDNIVTPFKKNLIADNQLSMAKLDREIDWSFENFEKHHQNPGSVYFTFGKIVWQYFKSLNFETLSVDKKWKAIVEIKNQLERNDFYIAEFDNIPALSLINTGIILKQFNDPIKAINEFYHHFTQVFAFAQEKNALISSLQARLQSSNNYYTKTFSKFEELDRENNYKVWADILMANLHQIKTGTEKITLQNFYNDDKPVEIKLKKDLSAQKNAEAFYKKSKNQIIEQQHLQKTLLQKEQEIAINKSELAQVKEVQDLKSLRQFKTSLEPLHASVKDAVHLPYHEFIYNNYKILVGRNAQSNDVLTLKHSYKEDLWLHAKDVAGSHVLIKYQSGKNFPKDVIERAAQLAAYNSKRKNESLCPVIVTPKKFVRKRKGDPAGAVVVEREEVIMVEPKL